MVIVKADKDSEAGMMPSQQLLTDMGKYNEELANAGVMQAGEGLQPSSKGARVRFEGKGKTSVIDGTETIDEVGARVFEHVRRVAGGEVLALAEENKHREFQFWAEQTVSL